MGNRNINDHFEYRKKELEEIIKFDNTPDKFSEKLNELEESILSVDITKTYNILLSWGGPSDGYKVNTDQNNEFLNVYYWFADWFTYDEIKLMDKDEKDFLSVYGNLLEGLDIKYW